MKQFIRSILGFSLFAVIFYSCAVSVWTFIMPFNFLKKNVPYPIGEKGFTFSRLSELDTTTNIDVLFLGSSHAFRGFDTRIFRQAGVKSFNLGSPSQTPIQTKFLLKQYLNQLNPKLIIYEVYPATFDNDGVESSLDIIANSPYHAETVKMAFKINHLKTYNTLIYDFFQEIFKLNSDFAEPKRSQKDRYISSGFVSTEITENESPITEKIRENWKDQWDLKEAQIKAFQESISLIENQNIAVLFVQMPVTREAYHLYKNNEEVDQFFEKNGSYINLNKEMNLDDQFDFMDYHHLNQSGVTKTNLQLMEKLKKMFPSLFEKEANE